MSHTAGPGGVLLSLVYCCHTVQPLHISIPAAEIFDSPIFYDCSRAYSCHQTQTPRSRKMQVGKSACLERRHEQAVACPGESAGSAAASGVRKCGVHALRSHFLSMHGPLDSRVGWSG